MKTLTAVFVITFLLVPLTLFAQEPDVYIYYGSPGGDADTIEFGIFDQVEIPVYFQAAGEDTIYAADLLSVLGINNGYIERFLTDSCTFNYPFTTWPGARYVNLNEDFQVDGDGHTWDSYSFLGFAGGPGNANNFELIPGAPPIHELTFVCRTVHRPELGDSIIADALGQGLDPAQGHSNMGDPTGTFNYQLEERYASVKFITYDGAIMGQVKNINDEPVENVQLDLLWLHSSTDSNGEFDFPYLPNGNYDLSLSHPDYCDETLSDIVVDNHDTTTLPIVIEYGGAITGIVIDQDLNPLSGVHIQVVGFENSDITDIDGTYLVHGLCPGTYDITAVLAGYFGGSHYDIAISNNDTTSVNIVLYSIEFPPDIDVLVYAGGSFENSTWRDAVVAAIGQDIEIPIWFYGHDESVEVAQMFYSLGINNAYIDSFDTQSCAWHYPLTNWDICYFSGINEDWQIDGEGNTWDSYTFYGFVDNGPAPYNTEFLHTDPGDPPIKILTFSVHVKNDPELIGEVVDNAISVGMDTQGSSIIFWDPYASHYDYAVYFSPFKFVNYQYAPGDANMLTGIWPPQVIGSDVTYLVNYFRSENEPCLLQGFFCAADVNGDCSVIGSDVTRLVSYFRGIAELSFCPEYPPAWPTVDEIPEEMPSAWPGCE